MTTLYQRVLKCQNCGHTSEYLGLGSTNQFGSVDLDTRPPEMARSTLHVQVQQCQHCGYCAVDISKPVMDLSGLLASENYRTQLGNKDLPELANAFLCMALLQEHLGKFDHAGWAAIRAAWVCDDANNTAAAKAARIRTVALFQRALAAGQSFGGQPGSEQAIIVDLLRRSERFDEAAEEIQRALSLTMEDVIKNVLEFQRGLIANRDAKCYTVETALSGK